jgi:hypothetical protein
MNTETENNSFVAEAGLAFVISPRVMQIFEEAERLLTKTYGSSPDAMVLVRLWLGCATPNGVQGEFERAVLDLHRQSLDPQLFLVIEEEDCL